MSHDLTIKLGDFVTFPLERKSSTNPQNIVKIAFVRYDGMPKGSEGDVYVIEVGRYDPNNNNQSANPVYVPTDSKEFIYRVDNYGRTVKFEIVEITPLELKVINHTHLPSAVDD